ncbi:unnamed protein product, partial [Amoebophrya sp. A25]|eukprot:GSA25T00007505001.1
MIADLALPSTVVFAIDNKQRQRRKAMQITPKAQLLEETEQYYSEESGLDTNHHGSRGVTSMLQQSDKVASTTGQQRLLKAV